MVYRSVRRTPVVCLILAGNAAIFAGMLAAGSPRLPPPDELLAWGASYGPLTAGGEGWRLLTSALLHVGPFHLLASLAFGCLLGSRLERLLGATTLVTVYLVAALTASLVSLVALPTATTVGSSGAIFGLFGALYAYILWRRPRLPSRLRRQLRAIAALFIAVTLASFGLAPATAAAPAVNSWAHAGGLFAGVVTGLLAVRGGRRQRLAIGRYAAFGVVLAVATAVILGWTNRRPPITAHRRFLTAATSMSAGRAGEAVTHLDAFLAVFPRHHGGYYARALAHAELRDLEAAIRDLETANSIDPTDWDTRAVLSRCLSSRGFTRLALGDSRGAATAFTEGADWCNPGDDRCRSGLLENLGLVYLLQGNYPRVMAHTATVNAMYGEHAWNWLFRAIAASQLGRQVAAADALERWVATHTPADIAELQRWLPVAYRPILDGRLPEPSSGP